MTPVAAERSGDRERLLRQLGVATATLLLVATTVAGVHVATTGAAPKVVKVAAPPVVPTTLPPPSPTTVPPPQVSPTTATAAPHGSIPTYAAPGSAANGTVGIWYEYPLVLPVIGQQPGWLQVRVPERPNGKTAWVQSSDVTLSSTPYRIVVTLSTETLRVFKSGYQTLAFPAGIGLPATPTPPGHFFVTVQVPPPSPGYGPFVISTSGHSEAITSWEGMGDALIAIHGPINSYADGRIGATGTRISNGCIRLHDSDLAQLATIPAGTPVDIVA